MQCLHQFVFHKTKLLTQNVHLVRIIHETLDDVIRGRISHSYETTQRTGGLGDETVEDVGC